MVKIPLFNICVIIDARNSGTIRIYLFLQGLNPDRRYLVKEINLMPGTDPKFPQNGRIFSGDYLMKVGLDVLTGHHNTSIVIELTAVK